MSSILSRARNLFWKKKVYQREQLDAANLLRMSGDIHAAIAMYRAYLQGAPDDVDALNNLGVCLGSVGDDPEAGRLFELAYSQDDSYLPGLINYAKHLVDTNRSTEALPLLKQAWSCQPEAAGIYLVYSSICFRKGEIELATKTQLYAWLANFEGMRYANSYLFYSTYKDQDEKLISAEHLFWAETRWAIDYRERLETEKMVFGLPGLQSGKAEKSALPEHKKIRIGYWSPDFRSHSVRYFFRPLLENHDRLKFEIFLYYDFHACDKQTELIKEKCDHFHDIYRLNDLDMCRLVDSHNLDVFVELAGHTSYNRVALLNNRFAKIQLTALGYPPTTGASSVDGKLLDRFIATPDAGHYYTEQPMVLPTSFWCFDPMDEIAAPEEPPCFRNGYITFGCVGNIAKISERILICWKKILENMPDSRLLIRSISFEDELAEESMRSILDKIGIDFDRVALHKPAPSDSFFSSYNEIDVILDTFPFNGGTTSCFAYYMGVPIVSLVGDSLVSRMGLSISSNMGVPELAVTNEEDYVARAINLANDPEFLRVFRAKARQVFKKTSLGDGCKFAPEFEAACVEMLERKKNNEAPYLHGVPALEERELVRRAEFVMGRGHKEAALKITSHCLAHYPSSAGAHLIVAKVLAEEARYADAEQYIRSHFTHFDHDGKVASLLQIIHWQRLQGFLDNMKRTLAELVSIGPREPLQLLQLQLYGCEIYKGGIGELRQEQIVSGKPCAMKVLLISESDAAFDSMREKMERQCGVPDGFSISYENLKKYGRHHSYEWMMQSKGFDILIIVHGLMDFHDPAFFLRVRERLKTCDLLGMAGARRWATMDWRDDAFSAKFGGYILKASDLDESVYLHFHGEGHEGFSTEMAVLDGRLLAIAADKAASVEWDAELDDAGWLLEEDWTHTAYLSGLRLGVDRGLMIKTDAVRDISVNARERSPGVLRLQEKYRLPLFSVAEIDERSVSLSVGNVDEAMRISREFLMD
ncbi:tetratricopeptide repeat protein [bacterium]|nr:MAG: tetratricopeptide repeat protein [bacterium]